MGGYTVINAGQEQQNNLWIKKRTAGVKSWRKKVCLTKVCWFELQTNNFRYFRTIQMIFVIFDTEWLIFKMNVISHPKFQQLYWMNNDDLCHNWTAQCWSSNHFPSVEITWWERNEIENVPRSIRTYSVSQKIFAIKRREK